MRFTLFYFLSLLFILILFRCSYQCETFQAYRLRTSNSVKDRNCACTQALSKRGTTPKLWDESLGFYTKSWNCAHSHRFSLVGPGERTNHTTRRIDCRAKMNALLFQGHDG
ncbi:hypothetical protein PHMEG_00017845 [Phytophthora megakarya]|uniref:Secreted protein n=1 Tax=Phytophthora megakarya TaxID=4795 RepID=A0A225VVJ7_9STRA|nr:hypothetical protein PHMEG_00017845 [Phytophthora megakarya]